MRTDTQQLQVMFTLVTVAWVGGWGFIFFRYPDFFARFNARFGLHRFAAPQFTNLIKRMGIVGMILAALSLVGFALKLVISPTR